MKNLSTLTTTEHKKTQKYIYPYYRYKDQYGKLLHWKRFVGLANNYHEINLQVLKILSSFLKSRIELLVGIVKGFQFGLGFNCVFGRVGRVFFCDLLARQLNILKYQCFKVCLSQDCNIYSAGKNPANQKQIIKENRSKLVRKNIKKKNRRSISVLTQKIVFPKDIHQFNTSLSEVIGQPTHKKNKSLHLILPIPIKKFVKYSTYINKKNSIYYKLPKYDHNYYLKKNLRTMLRFSSILIYTMAQIRANKTLLKSKSLAFKPQQIAQFFGVPLTGTQSNQKISEQYIHHLSVSNCFRNLSAMDFLKKNSELKILDYTKQQISKNKQLTPILQNTIDKFFNNIMRITNEALQIPTLNQNHELWKDLNNCLISINQFMLLMTPRVNTSIGYLNILSRSRMSNYTVSKDIILTNYRFLFDFLVSSPVSAFQFRTLIRIFKLMADLNIHYYYHEYSHKIIRHFWNFIKKQWYLDSEQRRIVVSALQALNIYSQPILDRIENLLIENQQKLTQIQKLNYLAFLIKYQRINSSNCREPKYIKIIKSMIKEDRELNRVFFAKTVMNFYMCDLWIPEYWLPFMKFIEVDGDNTIEIYKIFVLVRLFEICKNEIPSEIIEASTPLKKILQKNSHFQGQQLIKDFLQKQMYSNRTLACQLQIANSLRIINLGTIRTQHQIQFFCVDILLDNNCVIEINGSTHYMIDIETGKRNYDIKTHFRSRTLNKLGYNVIDVDLEDYAQGSFQVITSISNVVKNKEKMRQNKWIHLSSSVSFD